MILGQVVGEVWATRKHEGLAGSKLLIIRPHLWYDPPFEVAHLVAIDTLGAGVGEDVIVCLGEPARQWLAGLADAASSAQKPSSSAKPASAAADSGVPGYAAAAWLPIEAAVMAIVDRVELALKERAELPGQRSLRFIGPTPAWAQVETRNGSEP